MDILSLSDIILSILIVAAGSLLQGIAGYGVGTLCAPLLYLINPALVPAPLMLNAVALTLLLLYRNRSSIEFRPVKHALFGCLLGTIGAVITLSYIGSDGFGLVFGVLILIAVLLSVIGLKPRLTKTSSIIAGSASGFMGTITAIGGPPIAMIYQREKGSKVRANLSAFFLVGSIISLIGLAFADYLSWLEFELFLLTVPGVFLGFYLSNYFVAKYNVDSLKPFILGLAAISGVIAIIRDL